MAPRRLTRTFLDSGVLIAAYGSQRPFKNVALDLLDEPDRIFLSSPFVRHEVCPKALFNRRQQTREMAPPATAGTAA